MGFLSDTGRTISSIGHTVIGGATYVVDTGANIVKSVAGDTGKVVTSVAGDAAGVAKTTVTTVGAVGGKAIGGVSNVSKAVVGGVNHVVDDAAHLGSTVAGYAKGALSGLTGIISTPLLLVGGGTAALLFFVCMNNQVAPIIDAGGRAVGQAGPLMAAA